MSARRLVAGAVCALVLLASGCITNQRRLLLDELEALGYEAEETERGIVVFLPDVLFAFDRAELTETGQRKVEGVAELVERLATYDHLAIEGNTDSIGPEAYNQWLSEERAISVADALVEQGIGSERLEVKGWGETRPVKPNRDPSGKDDPAARRLNRRVEMILLVP
ncbi:MAG: OmpA family protein [Myxococcota bacterium]|nr:OmpA family protein [Myxococcota bacterium]